ncbi:hypothetical protein IQ07DRAFT_686256 [Pyrenochaeta sp. DS3sAY3a]|nr:hypothetical protein IQ07DRAFT_686256 [Pyrenochaeta sp. DS3sAY3a]
MAYRKYKTKAEQAEARKEQNKLAARRYRENRIAKKKCHVTVRTEPHSSIDNGDEMLEEISREAECPDQRLEKTPGEVECSESEWELPEHPSSRLMVEMKLARMKKDVQDIVDILQNNADLSLKQYVTEQRPCIQRTVVTLQALQGEGPDSTAALLEGDITGSNVSSTAKPPAHPSSISDSPSRSSSTLEVLSPTHEEILRSLEAEVQQQKVYNSMAWKYTRKNLNLYICV